MRDDGGSAHARRQDRIHALLTRAWCVGVRLEKAVATAGRERIVRSSRCTKGWWGWGGCRTLAKVTLMLRTPVFDHRSGWIHHFISLKRWVGECQGKRWHKYASHKPVVRQVQCRQEVQWHYLPQDLAREPIDGQSLELPACSNDRVEMGLVQWGSYVKYWAHVANQVPNS